MKPILPFISVKRSLLLIAAIFIFMMSCNDLQDDLDFSKLVTPGWNPEYAIPLVNSEYAVTDFFSDENQEFISFDEDGLISLIYHSSTQSSSQAQDFFFLDDRFFNHVFPLFVFPSSTADTITGEFSYSFYSQTNNQRIDTVIFKDGAYSFRGKTNLNRENAELKLTIPEIIHRQTNQPLGLAFNLSNPGGQQEWVNFETSVNLAGYKLIINPELSGGANRIRVLSQLILQPDANPNLSPYELEISGDMLNMKYSDFYGYMGYYDFQFIDTVKIDVFRKSIGGSVGVGPQALTFIVETFNEVGVPISFAAQTLQAYSPFMPPYYEDIYLFGPGIPNEFDILSPTPQQLGQSVPTVLDFGQTNFPEVFLSLAPREFYYDFTALLNPGGDSTAQNVVQDTSKLKFKTSLEFKLFVEIEKLVIQDTIDFNLSASTIDEIDYLTCRINTENGFPFDASVQIYFTDVDYNVLDSLIYDDDSRIIAGGEVGLPPMLRVTKPSTKMTDITMTNDRLRKIITAEKLLIRAGLSTTNNNLAKVYSDYSLRVKVGAKTGINLETN